MARPTPILNSSLTASDLMCPQPVTITPGETLRDAIASMSFNRVSGLVVVDGKGHCVGVLAATDIINFEEGFTQGQQGRNRIVSSFFDHDTLEWDTVRMTDDVEAYAGVTVREEMTHEVISVVPDASLATVANTMIAADVHRVLVIDTDNRLHGVISASDFVRAFAAAAHLTPAAGV